MAILTERKLWRRVPRPKSGRRTLSNREQENIRRAAEFLRILYRGRAPLSRASGWTVDAIRKAAHPMRRQTMRFAVMLANIAHVPVEQIISGQWPRRNACPWCGRG